MITRLIRRSCLKGATVAALAAVCLALLPDPAAQAVEVSAAYRKTAERAFGRWLQDLWPEAQQRGVSRKTFDRAVSRMSLQWDIPDLDPPEMGGEDPKPSPKRQAEFGSPGRYFNEKSMTNLAALGRKGMAQHAAVLDRIEQRTGVDREVLVAIWGRETAFSAAKIPHDAMSVLATQAFLGRRPDFFRPEVLAILEIAERGVVPLDQLKASWAGAMGHMQMLPGLYLKHAADGDGDGTADIWNSAPDAFATSAAFLKASGWVPGRSWAYEVEPVASLDCTLEGPDQGRPIADWVSAGANRVKGRQWPQSMMGTKGYVIMPAGRYGPAFIATDNYYAIKSYNESDLYVLFVGNLADRIAGGGSFITSWRDVDTFTRPEMQGVQRKLMQLGYNIGDTVDGLIGFRTRTATGMHQKKLGVAVDCWPNRPFIARLK